MNVQKIKGVLVIDSNKNPLCDSTIQIVLHLWKGAKIPTKNQKRKLVKLVYAYATNDLRKEKELQILLNKLSLTNENFSAIWNNWYKPSVSQVFFSFL